MAAAKNIFLRSFFLIYLLYNVQQALAEEIAKIAVLVITDDRPASLEQRKAARDTWLQLARGRPISYAFCLAVGDDNEIPDSLLEESSIYQDILVVRGDDDYRKLSSKVLSCFRALSAIATNQSATTLTVEGFALPPITPFDFVIKTDHDVFLRLDLLVSELTSELAAAKKKESPFLSWRGFVYTSIPPLRDLSSKNSDFSLPLMSFPPYTAGVGVILSEALLLQILQLRSPWMTLNEDQALGLWISQRETELGAAAVRPSHDSRFQQWGVCTSGQLAMHPTDPLTMKIISDNIDARRGQCEGLSRRTCGLCGLCPVEKQNSWFLCNDETGASLADFDTIDEVLRIGWAKVSRANNPHDLRDLVLEATLSLLSRAGARQDTSALSSRWQPVAMKQTEVAVIAVTHDATGVNISCKSCDTTGGDSCESSRLCAVSFPFDPPSQGVMSAPPEHPRHFHRYRDSFFGALSPPSVECDVSSGRPNVHPHFFSRLYRELLTKKTNKSFREGQQSRTQRKNEVALSAHWILFAAKVSTLGSCTLAGLEQHRREELMTAQPYEQGTVLVYPRLGAAGAQCTFVIDIVHIDGRVTVRYSPLARNAPEHLHFELFRVLHDAPIVSVVVSLLLPSDDALSAPISVLDLSVFDLHLPRWLLPPGRVASEKMRDAFDESILSTDVRLHRISPEAAWRPVQRGATLELPLPEEISMPECAQGAWQMHPSQSTSSYVLFFLALVPVSVVGLTVHCRLSRPKNTKFF